MRRYQGVPASQPGKTTHRLHLQFDVSDQAVWNNEAEPIQVWFEESSGIQVAKRRLQHTPIVDSAESDETRVLDVEFSKKGNNPSVIQGFSLYYICEKSTQQCILRRQDFQIPIRIE